MKKTTLLVAPLAAAVRREASQRHMIRMAKEDCG